MNIINKMAAGSGEQTVQEVGLVQARSESTFWTAILYTMPQVLNCALPSWYDQFKEHTVKR